MTFAPLFLALLAAPAADRAVAPTILDFTAPWCGPCQQMKPAVEQLARAGYPVKPVDYDHSPLVRQYKVTAIPTFVVVDADGQELGRLSGYRPAKEIAGLYNQSVARQDAQPEAEAPTREADSESEPESDALPKPRLPEPWKTVVRIKIENNLTRQHTIEFGSGTIIRSTPDETIILTCAHIFRLHNTRKQYAPRDFPLKIEVHLSDGNLVPLSNPDEQGGRRAGVHMVERHAGEAIDYDFAGDVGLIRIRPGRRLPSTPVVPAGWTPRSGMAMTTVGCSEGHDATAWSTKITTPLIRGVDGYPNYEAIECNYAPKQGRSGGGLYTNDGRLAGVCDFADPTRGHGLYATPRTIHKFLDRNNLAVCYNPDAERPRTKAGTLVAGTTRPTLPSRANVADTLRAQSSDDPAPKRLTIPSPEDLKVPPIDDEPGAVASRSSGSRRKPSWSGPRTEAIAQNERPAKAGSRVRVASDADRLAPDEATRPTPAELTMDPRIDRDPFAGLEPPRAGSSPNTPRSADSKRSQAKIWRPSRTHPADR